MIVLNISNSLLCIVCNSYQCWASYFVKVTSYILLATELFSYSYILPIK